MLQPQTAVEAAEFKRDVLAGLALENKAIPSKYLYDDRGAELFDAICETNDYYPTRTEASIFEQYADAMAECVGPDALVIEYGAGSAIKTRIVLEHLKSPVAYVPVDIAQAYCDLAVANLQPSFPDLEILPVCADFTGPFDHPSPKRPPRRNFIFFPGSTIGNFTKKQAAALLSQMAEHAGPGGALLLGVDLKKDPNVLHRAYNDSEGVTRAFNLNLLAHMNRELDADFNIDAFEHYALYNPRESRVEMHLVSLEDQTVNIGGDEVEFLRGESIHTENSNKYGRAEFAEMAAEAGFKRTQLWTDVDRLFSVQYFEVI